MPTTVPEAAFIVWVPAKLLVSLSARNSGLVSGIPYLRIIHGHESDVYNFPPCSTPTPPAGNASRNCRCSPRCTCR